MIPHLHSSTSRLSFRCYESDPDQRFGSSRYETAEMVELLSGMHRVCVCSVILVAVSNTRSVEDRNLPSGPESHPGVQDTMHETFLDARMSTFSAILMSSTNYEDESPARLSWKFLCRTSRLELGILEESFRGRRARSRRDLQSDRSRWCCASNPSRCTESSSFLSPRHRFGSLEDELLPKWERVWAQLST